MFLLLTPIKHPPNKIELVTPNRVDIHPIGSNLLGHYRLSRQVLNDPLGSEVLFLTFRQHLLNPFKFLPDLPQVSDQPEPVVPGVVVSAVFDQEGEDEVVLLEVEVLGEGGD